MAIRLTRVVILSALSLFLALPAAAVYCARPKKPPEPPPAGPHSPQCEPKKCDRCSASPCYVASGMYIDDFVDLQIPTAGMYPLTVSRRYDSSGPSDGAMGAGWSSSLTAHLYATAYLLAAPGTYTYEADVIMPDGVLYPFTISGTTFIPPSGRHDTLVQNVDGTYSLTPQFTRSIYKFNADGSLASLTDDYGNVITYTNDPSGRLQRMADASGSGRFLDVTWGPDGRLASVADHTGRVLKYFYGGNGTLTSFSDPSVPSDPNQRSRYYGYLSSRFGLVLSRIEDRWHRVLTDIEWYSSGEVKSYTEGRFDGTSTSEGEKYTYQYARGAAGGGVNKIDSLGTKAYGYNATGLVNNFTTYDGLGQLTSEITPFGTRSYSYDARGNVATMSDAAATWTYTYDANFPDKVISIVSNVPGFWAGWTYEYNPPGTTAAGALAKVFRFRTDGTTKDLVATYAYDSHGHVTSFTDENNLVTTYAYDAAGDLSSVTRGTFSFVTTSFGYDTLGRQTSVTTPDGQTTGYAYDVLDRITSVTLPKPAPSSPLNFVTTYSYDNYDATSGLVFTNVNDPNGRITKSGYDALGHVVQAIDAVGNVSKFTYQFNLLKKITDANGNETSYSYNSARELSQTTFPDNTSESYDISRGALFSKTDRSGHVFPYTYDGIGRVLNDGVSSYTYSGQNLTAAGDTQFTYDSSWRRVTETITGGEKTTYTYVQVPGTNPGGSLISTYKVEPPTGANWTAQTGTYVYDSSGLGRVVGVSWNWLAAGFAFNYAPNGQYSQIFYPNGQRRTFSYDNQGRLLNVANLDPAGGVLASFDYGYDRDWATGTNTMLGQRTSVNVSGSAGLTTGTTTYRYDALYQLTRADYPNGTYDAWTYDAIGNRTSWRGLKFQDYAYYKNGTNPNNGQRLRSDGYSPWPYDFTYDSNGNVTRDSRGVTYSWDVANRLTGSTNATFAYDYLGRRRSMTTNGSATRYISLGMHTVGERNTTAGVTTDYLFGPGIDEPLAKRTTNGAVSYYGADGLGSVVLVSDSAGIVTSTSSYTPWGESGFSELFGYTGRETTAPLGLWFYRARYYDANRGRFLSEDPILASSGFRDVLSRFALRNRSGLSNSANQPQEALALVRLVLGPSDYAYVQSRAVSTKDPFGLLGEPNPTPGQPYCDWGHCSRPACPPPWCEPWSSCMQKCVDIFTSGPWYAYAGGVLLGASRVGSTTGTIAGGAILVACGNHCWATQGCSMAAPGPSKGDPGFP